MEKQSIFEPEYIRHFGCTRYPNPKYLELEPEPNKQDIKISLFSGLMNEVYYLKLLIINFFKKS